MNKILIDEATLKLALVSFETLTRLEGDSWELGSFRIVGQATKVLREALAEQPAKPLTDEQITEHFQEHINTGSLLSFADGVRHAEAAHGITKGNT